MSQSGSLNFGVIGNGRVAALLDERGRIVWWCFPRFDADPVFCSLLAKGEEKGFCDVLLIDDVTKSEARYVRNTPIIETIISDSAGQFSPRHGFRPPFHAVRACLPPAPDHTAHRARSRLAAG